MSVIGLIAVMVLAVVAGGVLVIRRTGKRPAASPAGPAAVADVRAHILDLLQTVTGRRFDDARLERSLLQNGVESLTVLAFCNRVQSSLGITLEIAAFFGELSIGALIASIEAQVADPARARGVETTSAGDDTVLGEV